MYNDDVIPKTQFKYQLYRNIDMHLQ